MSNPRPFLSICIPTYNRAEILRKTLNSITKQEFFRKSCLVEIVISNNCSTDKTHEVGIEFAERYPGLVSYSRTENNIGELNFERVLRLGRGEFLKLQNDSFGVLDGMLEPWVRILKALSNDKPLVFIPNRKVSDETGSVIRCWSIDDFIEKVSFSCTWIGGFGIWRNQLELIQDFSRNISTHLIQTDVLFRLLKSKSESVLINQQMFEAFGVGRKGGYNISEVFGANYLSILRGKIKPGGLSELAYLKEKKLVLFNHILPFLRSRDHDFDRDNLDCHLRDYKSEPYFTLFSEKLSSNLNEDERPDVSKLCSDVVESDQSGYVKIWRQLNSHNETVPGCYVPFDKVKIGRRTYGTVTALNWGHPDEFLQIGHFCSIGAGVEFMLGGNHAMDGFSTYPFKVKYLKHQYEALSKGAIIVGDDVWIGNRVIILSGVIIGQGAVVGAGSVVTKDVAPYSIVGGNPAELLRMRFPCEVIEELLQLKYSAIKDESIIKSADLLYHPCKIENVRLIVNSIMGVS